MASVSLSPWEEGGSVAQGRRVRLQRLSKVLLRVMNGDVCNAQRWPKVAPTPRMALGETMIDWKMAESVGGEEEGRKWKGWYWGASEHCQRADVGLVWAVSDTVGR